MRIPALLVLSMAGAFAPSSEESDVVVYGGTPGGVAAAVAAARNGASVLLLEPTGHVGGLNSSGINTAETEHLLTWTLGGISLEFYETLGRNLGQKGPAFYFLSGAAEKTFNEMLDRAGVARKFRQRPERVEKEGARIRRVVMTDGTAVSGRMFIDASYEGDLMARAGISCTFGREGREEYGEELAGIRLDKTPRASGTLDDKGLLLPGISARVEDLKEGASHRGVMNYNFRLCFTRNKDNFTPIPPPRAYDASRYTLLRRYCETQSAAGRKLALKDFLDLYRRAQDKVEVNNKQAAVFSLGHFGGQFDYPDASYEQRDRIFEDHKEYTLGLLHFLATDPSVPENVRQEMKSWGLARDEFADNGNWPYYLYVREARRMKGRTVVTQKDVQTDTRKEDSVGMGSHFIDCHHVQRVALSPTEFCNEGRIWRIGTAYQIPYRALTPRDAECENLLVPVAASFSHVAFCTYRVESTWMVGGHAAGTAAAQALREGVAVQRIDIGVLQKKLAAEKQVLDFIPGQPVKFPHGTNGPPEF